MDRAGIMILWMIWCPEHLEPYRIAWPEGYVPASMCLVHQALTKDDEIIGASGGHVEQLNAVLREFGPLCCRYKDILPELRGLVGSSQEKFHEIMKKYGPPPPGVWKDVQGGS